MTPLPLRERVASSRGSASEPGEGLDQAARFTRPLTRFARKCSLSSLSDRGRGEEEKKHRGTGFVFPAPRSGEGGPSAAR